MLMDRPTPNSFVPLEQHHRTVYGKTVRELTVEEVYKVTCELLGYSPNRGSIFALVLIMKSTYLGIALGLIGVVYSLSVAPRVGEPQAASASDKVRPTRTPHCSASRY